MIASAGVIKTVTTKATSRLEKVNFNQVDRFIQVTPRNVYSDKAGSIQVEPLYHRIRVGVGVCQDDGAVRRKGVNDTRIGRVNNTVLGIDEVFDPIDGGRQVV